MNQPLSADQQIVASLRKIMRAVDLHSRRLFESIGMTGPQLATLQAIQRLGPTPANAIAREVHLSQATVTGILSRLEARQLITRQRNDADRRAMVITVSAEGQRLLDQAPSLLQDRFRNELARLEEWERLQILSTLTRVASLMGAENLDAAPHLMTEDERADNE
jgi:DNA-binding MarR family transcriptional regulator